MRSLSIGIAYVSLFTLFIPLARADEDVTASKSLTVEPDGPRAAEAGKKYFNIEGKDNGKYASFGVLACEMPKEIKGSKIKGTTLTLVQSVPAFAKDGSQDLPSPRAGPGSCAEV
jgi:hypothetical protein